jgi:ubiquinone biosynthesis protein UbiJ
MAGEHVLLTSAFTGILESALSAGLALAPNSRELLEPLAGKAVALRLRPFGKTVYLCPTGSKMQVLGEFSGRPDATLSGTIPAFARLGLGGEVRRSLASGEIEIEGDMDVARRFQALFAKLDLDLEARLARHTGSGIAAACFDLFRSGTAWTRAVTHTLRQDLAEYWQEETRELPTPVEVDAFYRAVDGLRADGERLEARLQRLRQTLKAGSATENFPP